LRHHLDDLRQQCVGANALRTHDERSGAVHRGADQCVPDRLRHGDGLAGHHRFVDRTASLHDDTVHWHFLSRPYAKAIARVHALQRYVVFRAVVPDAARGLRCKRQQCADRAAGLTSRTKLHDLSQQHEGDDGRCGLEVQADVAVRHSE
jgi:hypothetical protein